MKSREREKEARKIKLYIAYFHFHEMFRVGKIYRYSERQKEKQRVIVRDWTKK